MPVVSLFFKIVGTLFQFAGALCFGISDAVRDSGEPSLTGLLVGIGIFSVVWVVVRRSSWLVHHYHHYRLWSD